MPEQERGSDNVSAPAQSHARRLISPPPAAEYVDAIYDTSLNAEQWRQYEAARQIGQLPEAMAKITAVYLGWSTNIPPVFGLNISLHLRDPSKEVQLTFRNLHSIQAIVEDAGLRRADGLAEKLVTVFKDPSGSPIAIKLVRQATGT